MDTYSRTQMDIWERWSWLWQGIFYFSVCVSLGLTFFDKNLIFSSYTFILLTLTALLWHVIGMRIAYRQLLSWEEYPLVRLLVIFGDSVLWFILVSMSPTYYVMLFGLFIQGFIHLPIRYATIVTIVLTTLMILEQIVDM